MATVTHASSCKHISGRELGPASQPPPRADAKSQATEASTYLNTPTVGVSGGVEPITGAELGPGSQSPPRAQAQPQGIGASPLTTIGVMNGVASITGAKLENRSEPSLHLTRVTESVGDVLVRGRGSCEEKERCGGLNLRRKQASLVKPSSSLTPIRCGNERRSKGTWREQFRKAMVRIRTILSSSHFVACVASYH